MRFFDARSVAAQLNCIVRAIEEKPRKCLEHFFYCCIDCVGKSSIRFGLNATSVLVSYIVLITSQ